MATVMEAFDAQMMDYHYDSDVQMQPSHEGWFQDEALMEDDGQQIHGETQSNNTEYEAVEIDMEENYTEDGQNPEYEMADESVDYPVGGVDEEDDIVADESNPQEVNVSTVTSFQVSAEVLTPASTFSSLHEPHSQQQEASSSSFDSSHIGGATGFSETASAVLPVQTDPETEVPVASVADATQVESVAIAHDDRTIVSADEEQVAIESADHIRQSVEAGETWQGASQEAPASAYEQAQTNEETLVNEGGSHSLDEENRAGDGLSSEAHAQEFVGEELVDEHVPLHQSAELTTTTTTILHTVAAAAESSQPAEQHEAEATQDSLVSETTLEPPPGILLSFSSSGQQEVCLFTQPNYPESSTSAAAAHPHRILFEQSPALYYEPLSTVFEVLRHDETVSSIGDFSHSELVLDAYELQLTVSEDNIFARETSLYDLNQLHLGSDFAGPLRLRLQATSPRFIIRYRLLQEQIYRLDLAAQDYGDGEKEPEQYEGHGTVEDHSADQIPQAEGTTAHAEELTTAENTVEELNHDYDEEGDAQEQEEQDENDDHDGSETLTSNGTTEDIAHVEASHDQQTGRDATEQEEVIEALALAQDNDNQPNAIERGGDLAEASNANLLINENEGTETYEDQGGSVANADPDDGSDSASNHEQGSEIPEPTAEHENSHAEEADLPTKDPEEEGTANEVDKPDSVNETEEDLQNISENGDEDSLEQSDYADDWDDTFEEDEGLDTTFEEPEGQEIVAGDSNVTLSSKSSKRSIDEVDGEDTNDEVLSEMESPGSKRLRTA
ncbi:hypothetical protein PM082_012742 [Marasmius tenuissimus]|nr:hypothetical protein PM082_012742 [Marasmius tenuissimus]